MFKVELINGNDITVIHGQNNRLQTGSIKKETNAADTFEFSMLPNNLGYNIVHPLITQIKVTRTDNNQLMFDGRILQPKDNMESSGALTRAFTCEGSLAYFHDIVPGYGSMTGTWHDVINWLLNIFNEQSESWKHIELGDVPNTGNVTVNIDTENDLYDTMYKFIVTNNGYEWRIRNENNHRYLDVNNKLGDTKKEPVIRLAFNLQSMSVESDPTSVVSRVIPLGKVVDGANTVEGVATPRIHLGMIGKQYYVDSQDLINEYGVQAKAKIWDDVTDPNQLERLAINYLSSQNPVATKYSVTALDLSTIGLTTDDFEIYNYYHVNNPLMNVDDDLRVNGLTINIINPQNASLTIGDKFKRQTDYAIEALESTNGALDKVRSIKEDQSAQYELIKKLQEEIKNLQAPIGGGQYYEGSIIDVSEFQGSINWPSVVSSGLALSVIRIQSGSSHIDETYTANIPNAISSGANYAVYAYFSALNAADAEVEATDLYNRATSVIGSRKQPRFWMIDVEKNSTTSGTLSEAVTAYMNKLNSLGIPDSKIVIYVSNALYPSIDTSRTQIWIPSYGINDGTVANSRKPLYQYDLWQYTSVGRISGISGNVDMSTEPSTRFKDSYLKR